MRISDWSSDVCSSDLLTPLMVRRPTTTSHTPHKAYIALVPRSEALETGPPPCCKFPSMRRGCVEKIRHQSCIWQCAARSSAALPPRSEERSGGNGCVMTVKYRWSPYH